MSLRFKLLLIALSTLALPLAGWLFVRQMEQLLRQGQEQTLIATANALAQSLDVLGVPLPPTGAALYVHRAPERMVVDGYVRRSLPIRVLRNNVVIFEGALESLRRFKDDVNEVRAGTECGIGVRNYNDVQAGDQIECYERTEIVRKLA